MRVLLIENYQPAVRALKMGLAEENIAVEVAQCDDHGLQLGRDGAFDVIILDLMFHEESGFQLLQSWRRSGLTTHILLLTAPGRREDGVRGLDLGADACLAKPFEFDELLSRIRALGRRRDTGGPALLRVADLEIDTSKRTVRRSGQPIRLTPREFALLEFLARHCGQVVSRTMIWENLYQDKSPNSSNLVDVYIRYLRNKIDRGFPSQLITTAWGEGYLLAGPEM